MSAKPTSLDAGADCIFQKIAAPIPPIPHELWQCPCHFPIQFLSPGIRAGFVTRQQQNVPEVTVHDTEARPEKTMPPPPEVTHSPTGPTREAVARAGEA